MTKFIVQVQNKTSGEWVDTDERFDSQAQAENMSWTKSRRGIRCGSHGKIKAPRRGQDRGKRPGEGDLIMGSELTLGGRICLAPAQTLTIIMIIFVVFTTKVSRPW